jgi:hypothetical protein
VVLLAAGAVVAGCATPPPAPPAGAAAPAYASLVAAQAHRLEGLRQLHTRGSIELRWTDESGRHFENGDLDLWLQLPRGTALRVAKLTSEELFWLGSDDGRYWFFDMLSDPSVLLTAGHETDLAAFGASTAVSLRPLVLLDLLGLTPLPEDGGSVQWDERLACWTVQVAGIGGSVRIGFDADSLLPTAVEALDAGGAVAASSTLEEYESMDVPGRAPLDLPRLPERVEIVEGGQQGSVTLFLREHTGEVDERRMARLFDLEVLKRSLRPERVEER